MEGLGHHLRDLHRCVPYRLRVSPVAVGHVVGQPNEDVVGQAEQLGQ